MLAVDNCHGGEEAVKEHVGMRKVGRNQSSSDQTRPFSVACTKNNEPWKANVGCLTFWVHGANHHRGV